ncbi:N-acetylmuramoyl-L-alanine amidase [Patescibacteria group bacterium]|nr:N-acetylmuramoyl-L-alanine amidase [Patescibacteria group bacterium]
MRRTLTVTFSLALLLFAIPTEARTVVSKPNIVTRAQWGADESLLTSSSNGHSDPTISEVGETGSLSDREKECKKWNTNYPREFEVDRTVTHNSQGQELRWAQQYSKNVKLLVVHHTALKVTGDERTPQERMQALYQYHADGMGWGDIGYHYVIDENGTIYEGRAGGKGVIGGHAYCSNTSTVGVALMGNFEEEQPTQKQFLSLKKLLAYLAQDYQINTKARILFHGKMLPTIVIHSDINSTLCAGYYLREVMGNIRNHIIAGLLESKITPPSLRFYKDGTAARKASRLAQSVVIEPRLTPVGSTKLTGRPGGQVTLQVQYRAGSATVPQRARLAVVERSHPRIGIWQELAGRDVRVRNELLSPRLLRKDESQLINLRIQLPLNAENYQLHIGDIDYTLIAEGRRTRLLQNEPTTQTYKPAEEQNTQLSTRNVNSLTTQSALPTQPNSQTIRIRLGYDGETATISTNTLPSVNGKYLGNRSIELAKDGNICVAHVGGVRLESEVLRINPGSGVNTIASWTKATNRFRGIIECRIVDDELTLINELPLEQYLAGLAEEPDTEPYEKQRAFAIAARSYAAFYMSPLNRKFPDKPYDGDDSPARFQSYGGLHFEENNPKWVEATEDTKGLVITKDNQIVKTPYFSSDDGWTRTPEEQGWNIFPFADVFSKKHDPWCIGLPMNGHGVGMSGCGAKGQAKAGKSAEEILHYYYSGVEIEPIP